MDGTCRTVVSSVSVWPTSTASRRWPSNSNPSDGNGLVDNGTRGNLAGKVDVPHLGATLGGLFVHLRDGAFGGVRDNSGETLQQQVGAEPVIAVPVGGVDVGQLLAGVFDPVADALHLIAGERRVDQYGVAVAEDQRGGDR